MHDKSCPQFGYTFKVLGMYASRPLGDRPSVELGIVEVNRRERWHEVARESTARIKVAASVIVHPALGGVHLA